MTGAQPTRQAFTALDIMTHGPMVVGRTATVQEVADVMFASEVRHVPVVERGTLLGMVSDRDLRSYVLPRAEQVLRADEAQARLSANVELVMRSDVLSVTTETPVADIIDLMLREKIGAVPVLHPASGELLGMVSYVDVLQIARAFF